jgi:hypothetical protein
MWFEKIPGGIEQKNPNIIGIEHIPNDIGHLCDQFVKMQGIGRRQCCRMEDRQFF